MSKTNMEKILNIKTFIENNFSSLPSLLSKYFGASSVSTVHAMTLTGWGCAGIFSILLANFFTTSTLFIILGILYLIGFVMMEVFLKQR